MARLDEYRRKRDFGKTPEPRGAVRNAKGEGGSFVIQKHDATRLHYDLRLEHDGVYLSWAVPKGPSLEPGEKRLAVRVEDHPLEYGDFEGVIPEGEYGGGTVMLWDRGQWRPAGKFTEDHIDFELEGTRLSGVWSLIRMRGAGKEGNEWLLLKRGEDELPLADGPRRRGKPPRQTRLPVAASQEDEHRSVATGRTMTQIAADREAIWSGKTGDGRHRPDLPDAGRLKGARKAKLPPVPQPQLATLAAVAPDGDDWIHEIKFDGYRILARHERDRRGDVQVELFSRNGKAWAGRFPELKAVFAGLDVTDAVIDGEVVAYREDGSSSFRQLQEALSSGRTGTLVYQAFDILHLNGFDLRKVPLLERKELLAELLASAGLTGRHTALRYTDHIVGKGPAFHRRACGLGLEGIISKQADAAYTSGRAATWLKAKCSRHQELLVGGFTRPQGSRSGFGALMLGAWDDEGQLRYLGKVGTGFSDRLLMDLRERLEGLEIPKSPFKDRIPGNGHHWVRPELVVEVEFTEWTRDASLRHPTFRGVREDRDPGEIGLPPEALELLANKGSDGQGKRASRKRGSHDVAGEDGSGKSGATRGQRNTGATRNGSDGDEATVAGVRLSSPDRVLYPDQGVTKLALARYYEDIAEWILPWLRNRPLSLVRCPQGFEGSCFFQKHPSEGLFDEIERVEIMESDGPEPYLYPTELKDLVALVQGGVLELHVWGSTVDDLEHPDLMVFDLDPDPGVPWEEMLRVARELRDRLQALELASFVRTTGGKGLHLVVPLEPLAGWDEVKTFAQGVARAVEADDRRRVTSNMSKAKRKGKIFLDYLRNGRGATAIASYSTRAREGAPVAVPVRWDELNPTLRPDRYNLDNIRRRLSALSGDPWEGFAEARRKLTKDLLAAVGEQ